MSITERKTLNDIFPGWAKDGGIFSVLQAFPVPWQEKNISASLDLEYHGNISGRKYISPLIDNIISGDALSDSERTLIGMAIMAICDTNWVKQWETLSAKYNPIENYSMIEQMIDDKTVTNYGRTLTQTDNQSYTTHGFNSSEGVPTDSGNGTQTTTDGGEDSQTHNYQLKRSGNIGVTTSQQMLTSQRELWMWNFFRDIVFPDVDRILTIPIY